jgi:D-alanyl-lipoteichoic acid acyltransferase DltB (MBOAT superfamily)
VSFSSWQFLLFLPAVSAVFFQLDPRQRRWWLLAASMLFYVSFVPAYILVALPLVAIGYTAARVIDAGTARRGVVLAGAVLVTLGVLAVFKYVDFAGENVAWLGDVVGVPYTHLMVGWVLPIGLSFQTFQLLAYLFEVHGGRQPAERSFVTFALYMLFFPLQVAGPIERPQSLLPQLRLDARWDGDRALSGVKLIAWGLFKKMVLADRLALVVATVYGSPAAFSGPQLLLATVLFAWQIYYDFSGYTDVARGAARVLGIDLHFNFNRPYAARFVGDFWGRWHVSLTSWFRDYVYAPMAGRRPKAGRRALAVWVVFLLSGLWHGAGWTFVAWGGLHALYLTVGTATARARARLAGAIGLGRVPRVHAAARVVVTFALVSFAWIFFRAADLTEAALIVARLPVGWGAWSAESLPAMGISVEAFRRLVAVIAVFEALAWLDKRDGAQAPLAGRWAPLRALAYVCVVAGILEFSVTESVPFIYAGF